MPARLARGLREFLGPQPDSRRGHLTDRERAQAWSAAIVAWMTAFTGLRLALGAAMVGLAPLVAWVFAALVFAALYLLRLGQGRPVILLVEDDPSTAATMSRLFDRLGWEVRPASTGSAAIGALAERPRPEWMYLDLMLDGDLSGVDVLRHVREARLPIRVAVVTALPEGSPRVEQIRALRPDRLWFKPLAFAELASLTPGS